MKGKYLISNAVLAAALLGSVAPAIARALGFDGSQVPVVVNPNHPRLYAGDQTDVTVVMDSTVAQDTVVGVTSSDPDTLAVPSWVTVPSGSSTTTFTAHASGGGSPQQQEVQITAYKNGASVSTNVTVE